MRIDKDTPLYQINESGETETISTVELDFEPGEAFYTSMEEAEEALRYLRRKKDIEALSKQITDLSERRFSLAVWFVHILNGAIHISDLPDELYKEIKARRL